MRVLVDTHALIWAVTGDRHLSKHAHSVLASLDNEVLVSAASAWEVCTKFRLGKLPDAESLVSGFSRIVEQLGFYPLSISLEHAQRAGNLPDRTATRSIACSLRKHRRKTCRLSATSACLTHTVSGESGRSHEHDFIVG